MPPNSDFISVDQMGYAVHCNIHDITHWDYTVKLHIRGVLTFHRIGVYCTLGAGVVVRDSVSRDPDDQQYWLNPKVTSSMLIPLQILQGMKTRVFLRLSTKNQKSEVHHLVVVPLSSACILKMAIRKYIRCIGKG